MDVRIPKFQIYPLLEYIHEYLCALIYVLYRPIFLSSQLHILLRSCCGPVDHGPVYGPVVWAFR